MLARFKEERGVALVVALMVAFVVLLLSTVVVSQAIHNSTQSGYDRSRVQSIGAAEAGLNYYYNYLQVTPSLSLTATPYQEYLATAPTTASFTATPTYYDASGAVISPPFSDTVYPASVLITSQGQVAGQAPRTMQTHMNLTPVYGGFDFAIVTQNSLILGNNLTLNGYTTNDADIYVNSGNLTISNQPNIYGSVYVVAGSATMGGNSNIRKDLWANLSVTINNPASVLGNVTSSTGSISGSGSIGGNAKAAGTITGVSVAGASSPTTSSPAPPSQPVPQIPWVSTDWTNAGYTVQSFSDCTSAKNYVLTNPSGDNVVRISAVCDLKFANNTNVTVNGNLAIFTDGSITFENQNTWTGAAGSVRKLYLIDAYRSGLNCSSDDYDITTSNNTNFSNLNIFFYSPCTVNMNNHNTTLSGQIMGGTVNINNQFTMNFVPVLVPGVGTITGFNQDIAYIREVVNA